MVNDTLNGALRELGETMASNLTQKGVPSTYDEGLTTLAGKILQIITLYNAVNIISNKDILSYADNESAVLTAQLMNGVSSAPVSGVTVEFYRYVDGTNDILIDTDVTDNHGVAGTRYASAGLGDIKLYAKVDALISETCSIEDCLDYDTLTLDNNKFVVSGGVNINYSSNGLSVVGNSNADSFYMYQGTVPTNYILECDVVSMTLGVYDVSAELITSHCAISNISQTSGVKTRYATYNNNYAFIGYSDETRHNPPFNLKIRVNNGVATYFIDDVQVHDRSCGEAGIGFKTYRNRGIVIKNMKIKGVD